MGFELGFMVGVYGLGLWFIVDSAFLRGMVISYGYSARSVWVVDDASVAIVAQAPFDLDNLFCVWNPAQTQNTF